VDKALSHCRNCLRQKQAAKVQEATLVNLKRLGAQGIWNSICAWNPSYKKDKELLEKIQHRYTKMIINIRYGKRHMKKD